MHHFLPLRPQHRQRDFRPEVKKMNEHLLLDLATDLGYELAISGAETYRVEDSARLVLTAYGLSP